MNKSGPRFDYNDHTAGIITPKKDAPKVVGRFLVFTTTHGEFAVVPGQVQAISPAPPQAGIGAATIFLANGTGLIVKGNTGEIIAAVNAASEAERHATPTKPNKPASLTDAERDAISKAGNIPPGAEV
jgi:hypothetical protein